MPNLYDPEFDAERDDPPYRWRRAQLGLQAGARALGASLFELPPGASTFPLHIHHHNEELVVVISGRPTLHTGAHERDLAPGDVVACPAGRTGAHRIDNRGGEPVRVFIASTMHSPEINEYPETGQFRVRDHAPGAAPHAGALDRYLRPDD